MLQRRGGLDLHARTARRRARRRARACSTLMRDLAVVLQVLGEVDRGHAALAQLALDAVAVGEGRRKPRWVGHRCSFAWSSANQCSTYTMLAAVLDCRIITKRPSGATSYCGRFLAARKPVREKSGRGSPGRKVGTRRHRHGHELAAALEEELPSVAGPARLGATAPRNQPLRPHVGEGGDVDLILHAGFIRAPGEPPAVRREDDLDMSGWGRSVGDQRRVAPPEPARIDVAIPILLIRPDHQPPPVRDTSVSQMP